MKFNSSHASVERSNISNESIFTIKTTAKSFEILSSSLYTDPILAIVRELSCNAYDSHVAAGKKDIPFHLHFPNDLEPYFSVLDNGIGLSDLQIRGEEVPLLIEDEFGNITQAVDELGNLKTSMVGGLYTTYFDSTKTLSNDFIGALGLGSKSPFSYTSSFEIISRFNGIRYVYSTFLNENGIPTTALMGRMSTTECNGLEVKIPVKQQDYSRFINSAAYILKHFPVKPTYEGTSSFDFYSLGTKVQSGHNWAIYENVERPTSVIEVVQGNIPYKIDSYKIEHKLFSLIKPNRGICLVVNFDIGDLDVAANREEIRYDKRTSSHIDKVFTIIYDELVESLITQLNAYDTKWKKAIAVLELQNKININIPSDLLHTSFEFYDTSIFPLDHVHKHQITGLYKKLSYSRRLSVHTYVKNVTPRHYTAIVINDTPKSCDRLLQQYYQSGITPYKSFYVINRMENFSEAEYKYDLDLILKSLGEPPCLYVSKDFPRIKRNTSTGKKSLETNSSGTVIFRTPTQKQYSNRITTSWAKSSIDDIQLSTDNYLYFELHGGYQMVFNDKTLRWSSQPLLLKKLNDMVKLVNNHFGTSYDNLHVVGLPKASLEKIKYRKNWKPLFSLVLEAIPEYLDMMDDSLFIQSMNSSGNKCITESIFRKMVLTQLDDHSHIKQIAERYERVINDIKNVEYFSTIFGILVDLGVKSLGDLDTKTSKYNYIISSSYPMMNYVDHWRLSDSHNLSNVITYIKLVDEKRNQTK